MEEDTSKLRTEFLDFKKSIGVRLEGLEKIVQELQEKTNSISNTSNIININNNNSSNTSGSGSTGGVNDINSGGSGTTTSGDGSGSGGAHGAGGHTTNTTSDYSSLSDAATPATPRRMSAAEHIYEDPRDFDPDSLPRYRAPPPPGSFDSIRHANSSPAFFQRATSSPTSPQQQQEQVLVGTTRQSQRTTSSSAAVATSPMSRVSPSTQPQPHAQQPSPTSPPSDVAPLPPPRSDSVPKPTNAPIPPTSSPPRRSGSGGNTSPENPPSPGSVTNSVTQLRDRFQIASAGSMESVQQPAATERERTRNAAVLRSASNPSPSYPPAVRPRVKPRLSSVGVPSHQAAEMGAGNGNWNETPGDDELERHESGTLAIRGIRTRPGLDIQDSDSDTMVIGLISPFLDYRYQRLGSGDNDNADYTPSVPTRPTRPLSVVPSSNSIHSVVFHIESMPRFKAATKRFPIPPLSIEIECSLKLQSKDQLLVRLDAILPPGHFRHPTPTKRNKPQNLRISLPSSSSSSSTSTSPTSPTGPMKAHICIIQLGRDVSDDKILDQGWMLNIFQPCNVTLNPKELFKVKGSIKLLVEIKIDELAQSHC